MAAAGEADVGFARFARAVDDSADDRDGHVKHNFIKAIILAIHEALSGNSDQSL